MSDRDDRRPVAVYTHYPSRAEAVRARRPCPQVLAASAEASLNGLWVGAVYREVAPPDGLERPALERLIARAAAYQAVVVPSLSCLDQSPDVARAVVGRLQGAGLEVRVVGLGSLPAADAPGAWALSEP